MPKSEGVPRGAGPGTHAVHRGDASQLSQPRRAAIRQRGDDAAAEGPSLRPQAPRRLAEGLADALHGLHRPRFSVALREPCVSVFCFGLTLNSFSKVFSTLTPLKLL